MSLVLINTASGIFIFTGGIIVGILTLRQHKAAALLTITGWSLGLLVNSIYIAWLIPTVRESWPVISDLFTSSVWQILSRPFVPVAATLCIYLGTYRLLNATSSREAFFSLKYEGLDLRPDSERDS